MPLSFVVFVGVVAVVVLVPVGLRLAGVVLGRQRQLCPGCGHKALAMTGGALAARIDESAQSSKTWTEYECDDCHATYVKPLGTGMMTRQAWLAGFEEPIPTAIVVRREDD